MKYDPNTEGVLRDSADKERHQQIRDRLSFSEPPTAAKVCAVVDSLVVDGLLRTEGADSELKRLMNALRDERERQGLSLAEIAVKTGLEEDAISDLEAGQHQQPTLQTLANWAQALGKRLHLTLSDT